MFRLPKLFKAINLVIRPPLCLYTSIRPTSLFRAQLRPYSTVAAPSNAQTEELILFFESKITSSPNIQNFNESLNILASLYLEKHLTKEQIRPLYQQCFSYFDKIPKAVPDFKEEDLSATADLLTQLYQSMIESLDPPLVLMALRSWSQFNPKHSKPYWHFVEFLLTRTKFINLFEGHQIVELLESYYRIKDKYENDKFAYIFDKCDEYICDKEELKFSDKDISRLLYLYIQSNLGSDLFFEKMFKAFMHEKEKMSIHDLITCAWSFVSYNLTKKDKEFIVYSEGTYEKLLERMNELNSYQVKQFLWSYHKEREIFRLG